MAKLTRILLTALLLAAAWPVFASQPEKKGNGNDEPAVEPKIDVPQSANTLTLAECLRIGLDQQPTVKAAIASLDSARSGLKSLENLRRAARFVSPDLPYRKQQGEKGLIVGEADVQKALQETKYDIIRLYYTFVYARQQDLTAGNIITQLEVYYGVAKELLPVPGSGMDQFKLYAMEEAINEVKKLRVQARSGQSLALAALKEAMGVEQSMDFLPKDTELPVMGGTVTEEQVVCFALQRRPEIAMAAAGVDAFRLEVCAQQSHRIRPRVPTLAAGSDLHSRLIPAPIRNGEYRPGALAPEMPTLLVGRREERVERATDFLNRQDALFDKTRNLVTLEAINSYHNWLACTERMRFAKARYEAAKVIAEDARKVAQNRRDQEMLIRYQALEGKAQAEWIESVYEHIKSLATLERVTAGGVKPAFPDQ